MEAEQVDLGSSLSKKRKGGMGVQGRKKFEGGKLKISFKPAMIPKREKEGGRRRDT